MSATSARAMASAASSAASASQRKPRHDVVIRSGSHDVGARDLQSRSPIGAAQGVDAFGPDQTGHRGRGIRGQPRRRSGDRTIVRRSGTGRCSGKQSHIVGMPDQVVGKSFGDAQNAGGSGSQRLVRIQLIDQSRRIAGSRHDPASVTAARGPGPQRSPVQRASSSPTRPDSGSAVRFAWARSTSRNPSRTRLPVGVRSGRVTAAASSGRARTA